MCESVDLGNGNFAIVCGRTHGELRYCTCGRECKFLCDWKVPARSSGTCDAPICAQHAKQVAPNKHLCPLHQRAYEEWLKRHPPAQGSLFEAGSVAAKAKLIGGFSS